MDVSVEPSSLYMIRAAELFPKPSFQKEEENLEVPLVEREYQLRLYRISFMNDN